MASFGRSSALTLGSGHLLGLAAERKACQKIELSRQHRRHRQVEMAKRKPGQHAAARGALYKPFLDQVRLDDLLDDVALVAERRRHSLDPDRPAAVILGDATQVA